MSRAPKIDGLRLQHLGGILDESNAVLRKATCEINQLYRSLDEVAALLSRPAARASSPEDWEMSRAVMGKKRVPLEPPNEQDLERLQAERVRLQALIDQAEEDRRAARAVEQVNRELFARCKSFLENSK